MDKIDIFPLKQILKSLICWRIHTHSSELGRSPFGSSCKHRFSQVVFLKLCRIGWDASLICNLQIPPQTIYRVWCVGLAGPIFFSRTSQYLVTCSYFPQSWPFYHEKNPHSIILPPLCSIGMILVRCWIVPIFHTHSLPKGFSFCNSHWRIFVFVLSESFKCHLANSKLAVIRLLLKVASVSPLCHKGLIDGALLRWSTFKDFHMEIEGRSSDHPIHHSGFCRHH